MPNDVNLEQINQERSTIGIRSISDWNNVFMRSLPGQMILTFALRIAAPGIGNLDETIPQRRGNAQAIRPVFVNATLADIEQDTFTLSANGVEIFTNDSVAYYSTLFDSYLDKRQYVTIPENSRITMVVDHAAGANTLQCFVQTFYAPLPVLPPASAMAKR